MFLLIMGIMAGTLSGLLGSGGGIVAVFSLRKILKGDVSRAHATSIAIMLPIAVVSTIIYLIKYDVDIMLTTWITLGGIAGGIIGAKLLVKLSSKWIHKLFGAIMIVAAVRMFF